MLTQATHSPDHCFPLQLCMGAFIAESEAAKGIVLAESAIDAFIAAHRHLNEQMSALRTLEDELRFQFCSALPATGLMLQIAYSG